MSWAFFREALESDGACLDQAHRQSLLAAAPVDHPELHLLARLQGSHALGENAGADEHVASTVFRDEPETLVGIEETHSSGGHDRFSLVVVTGRQVYLALGPGET